VFGNHRSKVTGNNFSTIFVSKNRQLFEYIQAILIHFLIVWGSNHTWE